MSRKKTLTVTALAVMTADGKIAKHAKHNVDWSSKEDKKFLKEQIARHDAVVVGRNTFEVAKKALTKKMFARRRYIVITRSVTRVKALTLGIHFLNPAYTDLANFSASQGYRSLCVLGGTQIYSLLLKKRLINQIYLTIEPIIFGFGLDFVSNKTLQEIPLTLVSVKKLNDQGTVLLHYKVGD